MNDQSSTGRPTFPVVSVAVFQFLIAALALLFFARGVRIAIAEYSAEYAHPPARWYVFGTLLAIILVYAITATGLLLRQMWARWLTLVLATVPLCAVAVEKAIYKRQPGFDFAPVFLEFAIWLLVPISIWWWLVFTRKSVKAQFASASRYVRPMDSTSPFF
jgi:hypothetical protein